MRVEAFLVSAAVSGMLLPFLGMSAAAEVAGANGAAVVAEEPGSEILFAGHLDDRWRPFQAAGGVFERDAHFDGTALIVDVGPNNSLGIAGLSSTGPMMWVSDFSRHKATSVRARLDPQRSTGFAIALSVAAAGDPAPPFAIVYWAMDPDRASSRARLHVHNGASESFDDVILPPQAPETVRITVRPYEIAWQMDDGDERFSFFEHARSDQAFAVHAYTYAAEPNAPVAMALREISVERSAPSPTQSGSPMHPIASKELFAQSDASQWVPLSLNGGDYDRFAKREGEILVVDVPEGNWWGMTGIHSLEPILHVEPRSERAPYRFNLQSDPDRTTGIAFVLSAAPGAGMGGSLRAWSKIVRREDGRYDMQLYQSGWYDWTRSFDGPWDGRMTVTIGAEETLLEVSSGTRIRAPITVSTGLDLFANIFTAPYRENGASALALHSLTRERLAPGELGAGELWALIPEDAFEPADFLTELRSDLISAILADPLPRENSR